MLHIWTDPWTLTPQNSNCWAIHPLSRKPSKKDEQHMPIWEVFKKPWMRTFVNKCKNYTFSSEFFAWKLRLFLVWNIYIYKYIIFCFWIALLPTKYIFLRTHSLIPSSIWMKLDSKGTVFYITVPLVSWVECLLGDRGSIPGWVIPKTHKFLLDAALLNISFIRYESRVIQGKE